MHEQSSSKSRLHENHFRLPLSAPSRPAFGRAAVLEQDVKTLDAMEEEAARFGEAVGLGFGLDFECIVDRDQHFFMEMNTRIQVEHRVSELCYAMRFVNPEIQMMRSSWNLWLRPWCCSRHMDRIYPSLSGSRDCRILWSASMRPTTRYNPVLAVWLILVGPDRGRDSRRSGY